MGCVGDVPDAGPDYKRTNVKIPLPRRGANEVGGEGYIMVELYNKNLNKFARVNRRAGVLSEALLWNELKRSALGVKFTKQKPIGNYIADFYCKELKLVIEIDGYTHNDKYEYDVGRDEYMRLLGITVLRIEDKDVKKNMGSVLEWIRFNIEKLKPSPVA